jgi:predicted MFS family arabinose efflux permease
LIVVCYLMTVAGSNGSALAVTVLMAITASCAGPILVGAQTIASRCADPAARGQVFGLFSSAGMLGKTLTTASSGYLYTNVSQHSPYYAAALLAAVLLYTVITLGASEPAQDKLEPEVAL